MENCAINSSGNWNSFFTPETRNPRVEVLLLVAVSRLSTFVCKVFKGLGFKDLVFRFLRL